MRGPNVPSTPMRIVSPSTRHARSRTGRFAQRCADVTTLSLEGLGSRRPQVREQVKSRLAKLQRAIHEVLKGEPLPERAVVTGRGALIDGLVEWVERVTEIKTSINRSTRIQSTGNLSRQVGLSTALGLLELATASHLAPATHPSRLFDRLITRTKTLLTEYF